MWVSCGRDIVGVCFNRFRCIDQPPSLLNLLIDTNRASKNTPIGGVVGDAGLGGVLQHGGLTISAVMLTRTTSVLPFLLEKIENSRIL